MLHSFIRWQTGCKLPPPREPVKTNTISRDELRAALAEMLADPETHRILLRPLIGSLLPVQGGVCTESKDVSASSGAMFGSGTGCTSGDYYFPSKVGIATTNADGLLTIKSSQSGESAMRVRNRLDNITFLAWMHDDADFLSLYRTVNGTTSEKVRIANAFDSWLLGGNLGIGTSSPTVALDVRDGARVKGKPSFSAAGSVSVSTGSRTITGTNTFFLTQVGVGDSVTVSGQTRTVVGITSNTELEVNDAFPSGASGTMTVLRSVLGADDSAGAASVVVTGQGRLGFINPGASGPGGPTELYREGETASPDAPDNIILQTMVTSPSPSTLLVIKAPPPTLAGTSNREATLALSRDLSGGAEFLDLYNNGYSTETQYGIRIQKRGTGAYRDFVFDKSPALGALVPLMRINATDGSEEVAISSKLSVKARRASFNASGNVATTASSTTVTGTSTSFTSQVSVDDVIVVLDISQARTVTAVTDDTHLSVGEAFTATEGSSTMIVTPKAEFTGSESFTTTATITTTNNTATTLFSLTLVDGRAYYITARVIGRKSGGSERVFYWRAVLAYRQGGGAVIEGGTPGGIVTLAEKESSGATAWNCTYDTSSGDVLVRVTGESSVAVYWVGTIEYQAVASNT